MNCPICGNKVDQLFLMKQGHRCRECKPLTEQGCYDTLMARIDAGETAARALCNEAFREGDQDTIWTCQATLKEYERLRASIRKPGAPA